MQSITNTKSTEQEKESNTNVPLSGRLAIGALLVACFFLYFIGVSTFPAVDPAEAYYVEAAREMIELGDYVTPYLNYQIYFSKPIMTFWLIAGSYNLLGVSEMAARIPFACLCTVYVLSAFVLGRHLVGTRAGLLSGLCLAASPLLLLVARESPIDIAFSTFLGVAVMATAMNLSGNSRWSWPFIYIGLGLSMLTKGPAGILLYCLSALIFLVVARPNLEKLKGWLSNLKIGPGLLLFAAVVLPWHLWVWKETDGLFLKVFFLYENIARYAGHTNMGRMSIWFFIPVLFVGFLPFVSILLPAIASVLKVSSKAESEESKNLVTRTLVYLKSVGETICRKDSNNQRGLSFLLVFSAVTFCFFSMSGTKLITYILPIMGPLAVITAVYLDRSITAHSTPTKSTAGRLNWYCYTFQIFIALISIASLAGAFYFFPELNISYKVIATLGTICLLAGGIFHKQLFAKKQYEKAVYASLATLVLGWSILGTLGFHLFYSNQQSDLMKASSRAGSISQDVNMYGVFMPSAMFYAKKPVNTFFLAKQFVPLSKAEQEQNLKGCVIVRDRDFERMKSTAPQDLKLEKVAQHGQWSLYSLPEHKVERVMILEDVFRAPGVFDRLMAGDTSMGPLTVPYAAGRMYKPGGER